MTIESADFPGSSNLQSATYDTETRELNITFQRTGDEYPYQGVPPEVWEGLKSASSAGSYFATFIKKVYG